jgi:hypothetical protein
MNPQSGSVDSKQSGCPAKTEIQPEEIRAALREILANKAFSTSRRCGDFLAYVVEQTLLGFGHELKERTIGINVFGREPTYDTSSDAVVRIKATETRKRLAMYYSECISPTEVVLSLPTGGYTPQFHRREQSADNRSQDSGATHRPGESQQAGLRQLRRLRIPLLIFVLVLIPISAYFAWQRTHRSQFEIFWRPVLNESGPVYLVTSPAPVYVYYANETQGSGATGGHYVLTNDQFIGRGDILASDQIFNVMRNLGAADRLKPSDTINLREMSTHPVILIGYASTKWGALSRSLRYFVDDSNLGMITDNGKPTDWYPHHLAEDLSTDEDFALIARVHDPETRSVLILLSGATQYGTEAAASMATNPGLFSATLKNLPKDWENKNLEIVIHVKVIGNTPASPEIVAIDCP